MNNDRLKRIVLGVFLMFFLVVLLTYRLARIAGWVR
jgi:hypothetical protein